MSSTPKLPRVKPGSTMQVIRRASQRLNAIIARIQEDVVGQLGTMAYQNKESVDIDGGTIDGVTISDATMNDGTLDDSAAGDEIKLNTVTQVWVAGDPAVLGDAPIRIDAPAGASGALIAAKVNATEKWRVNGSGDVVQVGGVTADSFIATSANGYDGLVLETSYTPTSSSDANGVEGALAWDSGYLYVKTASGWRRVATSTF